MLRTTQLRLVQPRPHERGAKVIQLQTRRQARLERIRKQHATRPDAA
jgi:hypothetical protein